MADQGPRHDLLCKVATEAEAMEMCAAFVQLYREEARYLERTAPWIERVGLAYIQVRLLPDEAARADTSPPLLPCAVLFARRSWAARVPARSARCMRRWRASPRRRKWHDWRVARYRLGVNEIRCAASRTVQVEGGDDIAIFRTGENKVFALRDRCQPQAWPAEPGHRPWRCVACPLHNWRISLSTGEALGEDKGCTPVVPVRISGGRVLICRASTLRRRRDGPPVPPPRGEDAVTPIDTTCAYCGVGCGIRATVTATSGADRGRPDHPANRGRLCSKGTHLGETVGLEGRLLLTP